MQAIIDIAEQAGGDIRSAVTMLYASSIGRETIGEEDVSISGKDSRGSIFDLVAATLGYRKVPSLLDLSMSVDETPDTILQWIEGNIGNIADRKKTAQVYHALSRADMYLGYTFRNQYYTLWRYANVLMLYGVHDAVKGRPTGFSKIMPPSRWKQMSAAKRQKNLRENLLSELGSAMHMSASAVRNLYLCPVSLLAKEFPEPFARQLDLDSDQLDILIHDPATSKSVVKAIDDEKKRIEKELKKKIKDEEKKTKKTRSSKDDKSVPSKCSPSIEAFASSENPSKIPFEEKNEEQVEKDKKSSQSTLFSF